MNIFLDQYIWSHPGWLWRKRLSSTMDYFMGQTCSEPTLYEVFECAYTC